MADPGIVSWEVLSALIGAISGTGGTLGVLRLKNGKLNGNGGVSKELCDERAGYVKDRLAELNTRFDRLDSKMGEIRNILIKGSIHE